MTSPEAKTFPGDGRSAREETRPGVAVSIGVPVYNGEAYIGAALDSILAQTFTDFEVVICDNASTDATGEICRSYAARDGRIRYHRQLENIGAARNYNDAFHLSRGRYFKWAAHDDMIAPRFLERCIARLEGDPGIAIAFARMREIDGEGTPTRDYAPAIVWNSETPARRLESLLCSPLERSHIHRCVPITGLMRADLLKRTRLIGRFNHSDKVALVEMAMLGDFVEVPEYLFFRRMHEKTSLAANRTPRELAAWFDPSRRPALVLPRSRLFTEYARAILRSDLPGREKARCLSPLLRLLRRDWRVFGGEVKRNLMDSVQRSGTVG